MANQSGPFFGPAMELQTRNTINSKNCTCTILTITLNIAHPYFTSSSQLARVLRGILLFHILARSEPTFKQFVDKSDAM